MCQGRKILEMLVDEGWFKQREDGTAYIHKLPKKKDMEYFTFLVVRLAQFTVALRPNEPPPIQVTCGGGPFDLMFKVEKGKEE